MAIEVDVETWNEWWKLMKYFGVDVFEFSRFWNSLEPDECDYFRHVDLITGRMEL